VSNPVEVAFLQSSRDAFVPSESEQALFQNRIAAIHSGHGEADLLVPVRRCPECRPYSSGTPGERAWSCGRYSHAVACAMVVHSRTCPGRARPAH